MGGSLPEFDSPSSLVNRRCSNFLQHEVRLDLKEDNATVSVAVCKGLVCGASGVSTCSIATTPVQPDELVCPPGFQAKLSVDLANVEEGLNQHMVSAALEVGIANSAYHVYGPLWADQMQMLEGT
jgi:hypothetical protein